jgi:nucleoporin NUP159
VSSTVSPDIGLLSRSTKPLATDKPVVGSFTTTELLDDSRRPTLPMTESMDDSTPIGLALDLSSKDKVYKPIPSDEELEESPNPLPGFWVLTHEGILCAWWFIYNDAIKQGHLYSGMASAETSASSQAVPSAAATTTSAFGAPSKPAFGSASSAPAFGSPSTTNPMFGSSTKIGLGSSPWGAPSTSPSQSQGATFGSSSFGNTASPAAPAFGKPSTPGFGQSSALGAKSSPWGSGGGSAGASGAASGPAFGQSGFASFANNATTSKNTFGSFGAPSQSSNKSTETPSSSGFASFSNQGGFASVASQNTGGSIFGGGNQASPSPFSTGKTEDSIFGTKKTDEKPSGGVFGSQPFKLESTFKPDTTAQDDAPKGPSTTGSTMFGSGFGSALDDTKKIAPQVQSSQDDDQMDAETPVQSVEQPAPAKQKSLFDRQETVESTTPTSTPAPSKFTSSFASTTPGSSLFGKPTPAPNSSGGLFGSKPQSAFQSSTGSIFGKGHVTEPETPKVKQEEPEAPLPPDTTSRLAYPLGDSSSSSAASNAPGLTNAAAPAPTKAADPPLPIDPMATPKPSNNNRPAAVDSNTPESVAREDRSPSDFVKVAKPEGDKAVGGKPASIFASSVPFKGPTSFSMPKPSSQAPSSSGEGSDEDDENDEDDEEASEGSGVDVANDLSPVSGTTPGFTPQSSFGGQGSNAAANQQATQGAGRSSLFGELGRNNAAMFPPPSAVSPRSPSPIRRAVPSRLSRAETRSVSAPGVASQLLNSTAANRHVNPPPSAPWGQGEAKDPFMARAKREKAQKEKEETKPLVDAEDEERQKLLAEEVEGTLTIHEFIAHANNAPPAQESVPAQVEAVYRDINSMIDTVGLNARSVKAFVKGHSAPQALQSRSKDDLENADGWVLCEVDTLGNVLDTEVREDLETGRVQDLEEKLDACKDLSREMHRLRAKREDLAKVLMIKMDPNQAQTTQSLPLSAEQAAQQNELRKDFAKFSKLLAEAEEALTLLKAKIASSSGASGRGNTAVPTVEAVMRTITKMTSMVEKRSGDIDVLENQMRKMKLGSGSREGSPMVTPQGRRSIMFSFDSTPSRNPRHSFAGSIGSLGSPARGTPPRKKLSGFSHQEKGELMDRRARRQAVLDKLKESVEKKGPVQVWGMDDVE